MSRAFTLVEMLVVVAVIAILAAILLPVLSSAKRQAQRVFCLNNLKQINLGVRLYADEHGDLLTLVSTNHSPDIWTDYRNWIGSYVGLPGAPSPQDKLFACPADSFYYLDYTLVAQGRHQQAKYKYSSYAFNAGNIRDDPPFLYLSQFPGIAGDKLSSVKMPARTVLVTEFSSLDPYSWHQPLKRHVHQTGINGAKNVVSFVDGHVNYIKIFWDVKVVPGHGQAWHYDPPSTYDYQWSPN